MKSYLLICLLIVAFGFSVQAQNTTQNFKVFCPIEKTLFDAELTTDFDTRSYNWTCVDTSGGQGHENQISLERPMFSLKIGGDVYALDLQNGTDTFIRGSTRNPKFGATCSQLKQEFATQGLATLYRRMWRTEYGFRFPFIGTNQSGKQILLLLHLDGNLSPRLTIGPGDPMAYDNALYFDYPSDTNPDHELGCGLQ